MAVKARKMTVIDTNIAIRYLTRDDERQAQRARVLLTEEGREILILDTVLLEIEWVLRSIYGFDPEAITAAFYRLLGLPGVRAEHPERAALALQWHGEGLDFADALHLAGSQGADELRTFDEPFIKGAGGRGRCPARSV